MLYHRLESPERCEEAWQLVLPTALRAGVLKLLHDSPVGGHPGVSKTLGKACERFYWIHCLRALKNGATNVTCGRLEKVPGLK